MTAAAPVRSNSTRDERAMKQYLLSVIQPDGNPPPPEVLGPIMEKVGAWRQELRKAGAWVLSAGLTPASSATVVRARGGDALITDGPFVEGREHVGGFSIIRAADLDEALAWARRFSEATTLAVEVRPLAGEIDA